MRAVGPLTEELLAFRSGCRCRGYARSPRARPVCRCGRGVVVEVLQEGSSVILG